MHRTYSGVPKSLSKTSYPTTQSGLFAKWPAYGATTPPGAPDPSDPSRSFRMPEVAMSPPNPFLKVAGLVTLVYVTFSKSTS